MEAYSEQFKQIIIHGLYQISNPEVFKEFFSFLREIFYYNTSMDNVDFNLAIDTMEILNSLLKFKSSPREKEGSENI